MRKRIDRRVKFHICLETISTFIYIFYAFIRFTGIPLKWISRHSQRDQVGKWRPARKTRAGQLIIRQVEHSESHQRAQTLHWYLLHPVPRQI